MIEFPVSGEKKLLAKNTTGMSSQKTGNKWQRHFYENLNQNSAQMIIPWLL